MSQQNQFPDNATRDEGNTSEHEDAGQTQDPFNIGVPQLNYADQYPGEQINHMSNAQIDQQDILSIEKTQPASIVKYADVFQSNAKNKDELYIRLRLNESSDFNERERSNSKPSKNLSSISNTLSEKDNSGGGGSSSQMTVDFPANKKLKKIADKVHNDVERQRIKKRYDSQDCFNI